MNEIDNILYENLSPDIYCLVHNKITKLQQENKDLKEKNEFLMKRDNKCQMLEQVINKVKARIKENKKNVDDSGSYVETYTGWKLIPEILDELLDILKEVE